MLVIDAVLEEVDQLEGDFVECVAVFDGDVVNHVPRILLLLVIAPHRAGKPTNLEQCADKTLEWTLWAILREWRLRNHVSK